MAMSRNKAERGGAGGRGRCARCVIIRMRTVRMSERESVRKKAAGGSAFRKRP